MPFTFSLKQIVVGGLLLFASAEAAVISSSHAQYTVVNNCPDVIVVRNNDTNSTLAAGSSITKTLPINNAGTFVGSTPGFGAISGLIAGFQAPSTYYIAKLSRTPVFYGVSIAPSTVPATPNSEALCSKARCDNADCADALPQPPAGVVNPTFPGHTCPGNDVSYTIIFCPSGNFNNNNP